MRTERERHAELNRLLKRAIQCLESLDLSGANEALEQASAELAFPRDGTEPVGKDFAVAGPVLEGRERSEVG